MANRTGQQHNIAKINRGTPRAAFTPQVQYSTTAGSSTAGGEALSNLSGVLGSISQRVEDRLDVKAEVDANRAGAIAGGRDGLPELGDDTTIRGRAFNVAAKDAVTIRTDLENRERLTEYEESHQADPKAFRNKADAFLKGKLPALQQYDPALAQRVEADFRLRADSAEGRIRERQISIIRDQQLESNLRLQLAVQDEMAADAAEIFTSGPQEAEKTLARMMGNAAKLVDSANMIGPDGRPLFSARERVAAEREAGDMVAEKVGLAWMQKQPDVITAYQDWQGGKAEIELAGADGSVQKVNLRTLLGENGYQKASSAFMDNLRGQLSLNAQIDAAQERTFKDGSDQTFTSLSVQAQDGTLTPTLVEAFKPRLEPDKYLALREVSKKGGATVSAGSVYSSLAIDDANGQDIRPRLNQEYNAGTLTRDDFLTLYDRNAKRVNEGTKDAVVTGRDYLTQGLGVLSKEIGFAQSAAIGQANAEYEIETQSFVEKNKRQPTHTEARDMAEKIRGRYSVIGVQDSILSMPLPKSMTQSEKLSRDLTSSSIEKKVSATSKEFLAKHNGDAAARDSDPDYKREVRLLQDYYDLLKLKEQENAGTNSSAK